MFAKSEYNCIQYDGDDKNRKSSLISYCDAKKSRSLFIEIRGDVICAGLKTVDNDIVEICTTVKVMIQIGGLRYFGYLRQLY